MQNNISTSVGNGKSHTFLLLATMVMIVTLWFQSFHTYTSYVVLPIVALWVPFIVAMFDKLCKNERAFVIVSIIYMLMALLYNSVGYSRINILGVIRIITWMMSGVIPLYVLKMFTVKELNRLYVVFLVSELFLLYLFAILGHAFVVMDEQRDAITIASTWQSSLIMLISGISLIFFLHVKHFWFRIISLCLLVLTIYVNVFIFQRGTNFIFSVVEIALIFVFCLKNKIMVRLFSAIVIIFAFVVYASDSLVLFFEWLADVSPSDRLADRFMAISYAIQYEDISAGGGSLSARDRLIGVSWNTFTSNFINFLFGAGEHLSDNTIIGHHSMIIDTLASYGILGGVLFFIYFKKQYQLLMSNIDKKTDWAFYWQCSVVYVIYLLRNFYGSCATANVNILLMLFFPLTIRIIQNYKSNKKITT